VTVSKVSASRVAAFRTAVYGHFRLYGRDLPWRRTADPYRILVSEVMLQQTQAGRVAAKYDGFVAAFPDLQTLAEAPLRAVLEAWQGLGYNRRAQRLQLAARMALTEWGGRIPAEPGELARLPGIGRATAAAVAVFAFDIPVVFIETNIRAALLHVFFPTGENVPDSAILPYAERVLDRGRPRYWYNALMDYGAMLKRERGNACVRSAHYSRQTPFSGSGRQVRGRVIAALTRRARLSLPELTEAAETEPERVRAAVEDMIAEGLLRRTGGRIAIA